MVRAACCRVAGSAASVRARRGARHRRCATAEAALRWRAMSQTVGLVGGETKVKGTAGWPAAAAVKRAGVDNSQRELADEKAAAKGRHGVRLAVSKAERWSVRCEPVGRAGGPKNCPPLFYHAPDSCCGRNRGGVGDDLPKGDLRCVAPRRGSVVSNSCSASNAPSHARAPATPHRSPFCDVDAAPHALRVVATSFVPPCARTRRHVSSTCLQRRTALP